MIPFLLIHLIIQIILILISSINEICLVISMIIYFIIIFKEKFRSEIYLNHYYSSLINVLFHYFVFTLSYAEILPWETIIVILLFVLIIYYHIKFNSLTNKFSSYCFPFDKNSSENDSTLNLLITKCQIINICFYIYTFHLCLTTICTPEMYFNWFLLIKNCRFTYSNFHSSYTLSGGMIISLTWAMISIYYFIKNRFR